MRQPHGTEVCKVLSHLIECVEMFYMIQDYKETLQE